MNETDKFIVDLVNVFRSDYSLLYDFDLIFSTNDLEIDLLNESAYKFFKRLNGLYSIYFYLTIIRMLDPAIQNKHKNLSLYGLLELAKGNQNYDQLKNKIDAIKGEADIAKIKHVRNKYIGHRDIDFKVTTDMSIEFEKIKPLYDRIGDCINDILVSLGKKRETWTEPAPDDQYGAMALLECLKDAQIYREIQTKIKAAHVILTEDLNTKYGKLKFESSLWKS